MPRKRTGTLLRHDLPDGTWHYDVQVTLPNGKRSTRFHLPPGLSEAKAREAAQVLADKATSGELTPPEAPVPVAPVVVPVEGETLDAWSRRWFADRRARGYDCRPDESRWEKWIGDRWGSLAMVSITREQIEDFVAHLDAEVRAGRLAWKSAGNCWGLVTKAWDDATNAKDRSLRILSTNPAAGLRGPDRGAAKAKEHLRPHELLALVGDDSAPVLHRRVVAVAVYLYLRPGELAALEWKDVDLDGGVATIHQALDRDDGVKSTKTDEPRLVPIEPTIAPVLRAMHEEAGGEGRVFPVIPDEENLSRWLRRLLKRAGVDRTSLYEATATRRAIRFYDTRATGITWRLIRGDEPHHVKEDAGHERFDTTEIYARRARVLRSSYGEVFPSLPESLAAVVPGESHSANRTGVTKRLVSGGERGIRTQKQRETRGNSRVSHVGEVGSTGTSTDAKSATAGRETHGACDSERADRLHHLAAVAARLDVLPGLAALERHLELEHLGLALGGAP